MSKAREFWIYRESNQNDLIAYDIDHERSFDKVYWTHVIEKSAYDDLQSKLDVAVDALEVADRQGDSLALMNEHVGYQFTQPIMNLRSNIKQSLKTIRGEDK